MLVLGVESSCDDTAAAVLRGEREILSSVVASQLTHREYGGVVPELASRQHLKHMLPVMQAALGRAGVQPQELDGVAATVGPGLLGSLLVGLSTASAYAMGLENTHGTITPGKEANLIITKPMPAFGFMPYSYGASQISKVILNGKIEIEE